MQTDCFLDLPIDWNKGPVSRLAQVNPRYPARKNVDYPFIEMASVAEQFGGIIRIESRKLEGSGLSRFKTNDILFAKITPCPQNGKVAFVNELPEDVGLGSTEFIVLSPVESVSPRFVYHLVCSNDVRGRAVARMEGSTGRQRVPEEVFEKRLLVPIPKPNEQAAIARILDAADKAIERTRSAVEEAHGLKKAVLGEAFLRLGKSQTPLGTFTKDVRYGTSKASNDKGWGNPTLRIPNIIGDSLSLSDVVSVDLPSREVDRLCLIEGDLLLVRTNGNPGYVGRSAVFRAPDQRRWIYASYLIRLRLNNRISPDFLNVYLGTQQGRKELLRRVTTSAGNNNINGNSIRLIPVPETSPKNQEQIVSLAKACREQCLTLQSKLTALEELKKSLMHDLLSGKVRVPINLIKSEPITQPQPLL